MKRAEELKFVQKENRSRLAVRVNRYEEDYVGSEQEARKAPNVKFH